MIYNCIDYIWIHIRQKVVKTDRNTEEILDRLRQKLTKSSKSGQKY